MRRGRGKTRSRRDFFSTLFQHPDRERQNRGIKKRRDEHLRVRPVAELVLAVFAAATTLSAAALATTLSATAALATTLAAASALAAALSTTLTSPALSAAATATLAVTFTTATALTASLSTTLTLTTASAPTHLGTLRVIVASVLAIAILVLVLCHDVFSPFRD
jgi:voltage-gated potassium channel Kch